MFGILLGEQAALPKRGSVQEKGDWLLKTLAGQEPGALAEAVSTFVRKTYDVDVPESAAWIESLPAEVIRDTAKVQQVSGRRSQPSIHARSHPLFNGGRLCKPPDRVEPLLE